MAERRMFAKSILDSDKFLEMPLSTQMLYVHLAVRADDDGFINNPKKIMKMLGVDEDSLKLLILKRFLIPFESGVMVIRHWRVHNYIRKDRYHETTCLREKRTLAIEETGTYVLDDNVIDCPSTSGQPLGIPTVDAGKVRLGKVSLVNSNDINTDISLNKYIGQESEKNQVELSTNSTVEEDIPTKSVNVRTYDKDFEWLWLLYPKKQGKDMAKKAYAKAIRNGTTNEQIETGIKQYCEYLRRNCIEDKYIKKGSTWFNQACWNDDYTVKGADNLKKQTSYDLSKVRPAFENQS